MGTATALVEVVLDADELNLADNITVYAYEDLQPGQNVTVRSSDGEDFRGRVSQVTPRWQLIEFCAWE